jgi:hypothetical protein
MMNILGLDAAFVNHAQGRQYRQIFETYPTVRICRDLIREYVFERPLIGLSDAEQPVWRLLGMEMFDQAMVLGFTIVRARPGTVPAVVPWEMCRVAISYDKDFRRNMIVYPARMDSGAHDVPMSHVYVLDVFGFSPSIHGEINSLMRPLRYKIDMIRDQMDCAIAADRARARPPCFTETHDDATAPNQEVTYDYYADATSVQQTSMNTYMRNQGALEQLEAQQESLRVASGSRPTGPDARENVAAHNVSTAVRNAIDSITPMPIGQRVARGPECHAPDALVERMRFIEQEVFVLLGVPRSFCMHDITVRHDAGMLHCTMTRTVHKWQDGLGDALSFVYNVLNNGPPKKRKRINVHKIAKERNLELRFERMPRVSVHELTYAYQSGVVTWDAYKRQMATFCGFAPADTTTGGDPWSKEDKLALLGVSKPPDTEFSKDKNGGGL